jgi:SAM-dependent methyltransferase
MVSNRLHFKVADMRENYGEKKFELVLNLFTSFAYFEDWQDNFQALQQIHRSLKDDGLFVLDFLNISSLPRDLDRIEKTEIEGYSFHVRRYIEDAKLEKDISVKAPDGQDYSFKESIWALSLMDLQAMFKDVGFEILDTYGSYKLTNFEALESDRLILLARKA